MAEVYVRNSLNPYKVIKVGVSFVQTVDYNNYDGELIWVLEVGTDEPHYSTGGKIPPAYVNNLDLNRIDLEIKEAVNEISSQVDWGVLIEDVNIPFPVVVSPESFIVDMNNSMDVVLKDILPSAGIDKESINVKVNGIDVSDDLKIYGTPFEYRIIWGPKEKVFDTYT